MMYLEEVLAARCENVQVDTQLESKVNLTSIRWACECILWAKPILVNLQLQDFLFDFDLSACCFPDGWQRNSFGFPKIAECSLTTMV